MEEQDKQMIAGRAVRYFALVLLLLPYLISGFSKLFDFTGARTEVADVTGLTGAGTITLLAAAVIATHLGGSGLLLSGRRFDWVGGIVLAGFTLIAAFLAHAWWHLPQGPDRASAFNDFLVHIGLVGALIYVSARSWNSQA